MTTNKLIKALQRLKVETGSIACLGCGHEHTAAYMDVLSSVRQRRSLATLTRFLARTL